MNISIIIPIYNVEKYLPKCLDSVCSQGVCVKEIILVNDGSSDNSLKICRHFAKKDNRIKIIDQENKGLSSAVRIGVNSANCEYIGFVDSDDYVEPNMFAELTRKVEDENADIAFCDYDLVDEDGNIIQKLDFGISSDKSVFVKMNGVFDIPILPTLKDGRFVSGSRCNKLIRKDLLISNLSFKDEGIRVGEDIALTIPVIFTAKKIVYIRKSLYHYVQRTTSIVHSYNRDNLNDWKKIIAVIDRAQKKYNYNLENFSDIKLALLLSVCLYKIKTSGLSRKELAIEYRQLGEDGEVNDLLKAAKLNTNIKHKLVFALLKHKKYGLLSAIYR